MSGPLRRPIIPQCSACVRSYTYTYAFGARDAMVPATGVQAQVRGKKKMANNSATVPVRLLKDVPSFGRKGHILPVPRGQMRNSWFPQKVASYITVSELRTIRLNGTPIERDFAYGETLVAADDVKAPWEKGMPLDTNRMSTSEIQDASAFQRQPILEKLSPERSMELVEIFVPKRLDFYRQPIIEEKTAPAEAEKPKWKMGGAAGDLLAARQRTPAPEKRRNERQAIYGSVSVQDVLVAMRAAMETNDEAARVALQEADINFADLPKSEEAGKVKHVGEFAVELKVKGAETGVRRTVKVIAQEM